MTLSFDIDLPEDFPASMAMAALISKDEVYRYWLARAWDLELPPMVFIGLNPSTADAVQDDPTIRRCISFAKAHDCGSIVMVNLFAFRATEPIEMKKAADPIGPANDDWLVAAFGRAKETGGKVVAAWGVHGQYKDRDYAVAALAERGGVELLCLGKTQAGDPRHPLYLKSDTPLEPLRSAA